MRSPWVIVEAEVTPTSTIGWCAGCGRAAAAGDLILTQLYLVDAAEDEWDVIAEIQHFDWYCLSHGGLLETLAEGASDEQG